MTVPLHSSITRMPLLSYGFRPFFLGGALWAAIAMALWIGAISGWWPIAADYGTVMWHIHEFLFGYAGAIIAGFLLTAIPNWTGRLPVLGMALLALFLLWCAGRIALLASDRIGVWEAVAIDSLFLPTLALAVLREIAAGRNWRNLKTAILVALLAIANIGFHAEAVLGGVADYALRAGIAAILGLIMLIGGRIVPSFTRNWLVRAGVERLPSPFGRFDTVSIVLAAAALAAWVTLPDNPVSGAALLIGGVAQAVRLSRWAGLQTWREPLVFILHAGFAFVPLGFLLVGAAVLWPEVIPPTGAIHIWTVGAIALMTLAVMTRATRGHSGRALTADAATASLYAAVALAAVTRFLAALVPDASGMLLDISGVSWIVGFGLFVLGYGPMLVSRPRA